MRGLSRDFLRAMREKLDSGRRKGRVGWDRRWADTCFADHPCGRKGSLMVGLLAEVAELAGALPDRPNEDLTDEQLRRIRAEAADVANFAMMVADIHGALDTPTDPEGGAR